MALDPAHDVLAARVVANCPLAANRHCLPSRQDQGLEKFLKSIVCRLEHLGSMRVY
jgi:hypothetical protein